MLTLWNNEYNSRKKLTGMYKFHILYFWIDWVKKTTKIFQLKGTPVVIISFFVFIYISVIKYFISTSELSVGSHPNGKWQNQVNSIPNGKEWSLIIMSKPLSIVCNSNPISCQCIISLQN